MPTYRFPIFLCRAFDGSHTATLVEFPDAAPAVAPTAATAVEQVKQYLVWKFDHEPWSGEPDLTDAELSSMTVQVRPEYEQAGRRYPVAETVDLRVWLVTAKDKHDMNVCSMPTLGITFSYSDSASLKQLVNYRPRIARSYPSTCAAAWVCPSVRKSRARRSF